MIATRKSGRTSRTRGIALGMVLLMGLVVLALGMMMISTSGNLRRVTADAKANLRARYAAESMVSVQMARLDHLSSTLLGSALQLDATTLDSVFSGTGEKAASDVERMVSGSVSELIPNGRFTGMKGVRIPFRIKASGLSGAAKSKISADVYLYQVPIFQFGVFFEGNLEITPGPSMTVMGPVHTNGKAMLRAYGGSNNEVLTFQGPITAVGKIYHWLNTSTGKLVYYPAPDQPSTTSSLPQTEASRSITALTEATRPAAVAGVYNVRDQVDRLDLPIGGASARDLILPCTGTESSSLKKQKFHCMIKSGDIGGFEYIEGTTFIRPSWLSDYKVFFDRREDRWVRFRDIDVAAAMAANTDDSIFYFYDKSKKSDRGSKKVQMINAFRLVNGANLTRNVSFVTGNPVYVMGDFNKASAASPCRPGAAVADKYCNAMIASDAITLLSGQYKQYDYAHLGMDGTLERSYVNSGSWVGSHTWDSIMPDGSLQSFTNDHEKNWGTPDRFQIDGFPDSIHLHAAILTGTKPTPDQYLPPTNLDNNVFNGNGEGGWIGALRFLENLRGVDKKNNKDWWETGNCPQSTPPPIKLNNSNRMTVIDFKGSFVVLWNSQTAGLNMDPNVHVMANTKTEYKSCLAGFPVWEYAGPGHYGTPSRLYQFDEAFRNIDNMPPGTPFLSTGIYSNFSIRN